MAGSCIARVSGRFQSDHQSDTTRNCALGNRLRCRYLRIEQDGCRSFRQRRCDIQLEARQFLILHKGRICFAKVLTMIQGEGGKCPALGGDLLQSAKLTD